MAKQNESTTQNGSVIWNSGKYMIPVVGTYHSVKDAINEPSWKNIGLTGLSVLGDVASIFGVGEFAKAGVGAIKAGKTLKAMRPAFQAVEETSKIANKAAYTYKKARQATNSVSLMKDLDAPISTVTKMAKRQEAAKNAFNVANKNANEAYKYWDDLQKLYHSNKYPVNTTNVVAGGAGYIGTRSAQIQHKMLKQGGVLKQQNQKVTPVLYDPKGVLWSPKNK